MLASRSWCSRAEVDDYEQKLVVMGGSWCLWAKAAYKRQLGFVVLMGGSWCIQATVGACRRTLVLIGDSWRLWAEVGVSRQNLVLIGANWCL